MCVCVGGGGVNKFSEALARSALEPVNESISSPKRSSSSSLELTVLPFCFLIHRFLCEILSICFSVKEAQIVHGL